MAAENANRFLERLSTDSAFRAEFKTVAAGNVSAILDFGLAKGYIFTDQELKSALANFPDNPTIETLRSQLKVAKARNAAKRA
jgi:predicted ribosomally synthesized peptide with nif11-like leader